MVFGQDLPIRPEQFEMKLSAAGRIKAVYSGGWFANDASSSNFAVACRKGGGFECMLSQEGNLSSFIL